MKIKMLAVGYLILFAACPSIVSASISIEPRDEEYSRRNVGLFIGIDDDANSGKVQHKGSVVALDLNKQFKMNYGVSYAFPYDLSPDWAKYPDPVEDMMQLSVEKQFPLTGDIENYIFYINGHGSKTDSNGLNKILLDIDESGEKYVLKDYELEEYLNEFDDGINKIVIIDSCYSG